MIASLAALALTPIAYGFGAGTTTAYYVRVGLDGFLPVLGGRQGKAEVNMAVSVSGLRAAESGDPRASSDLTDFHIKFNGAEFPVDLETAKGYFPKNTVTFSPEGHVVENDAPDVQLPIRLPGLDPKRFPDISYLPIEFPVGGVEEGKSWTFKKNFEGSDLNYTVTPTHVDDTNVEMKVDLAEHDEYFEDESHAVVADQAKAASQVVTDVTGTGTASFDRKRNVVIKVAIKMTAQSNVTDLTTKEKTPRRLDTTLDINADQPLPSALVSNSGNGSGLLQFLGNEVQKSRPIQRAIIATQLMHPGDGGWRSAVPLVRSAVNSVHIPSQDAMRGQVKNFSKLASHAVARVPELLNVQSVKQAGSFLSSVPGVVTSYWRPHYVGAYRFTQQVIHNFTSGNSSTTQTRNARRR